MTKEKDQKVILTSKDLGDREFTFSDAKALVKYETKRNISLWTPKGTKYKIEDGELILNQNTGTNKDSD